MDERKDVPSGNNGGSETSDKGSESTAVTVPSGSAVRYATDPIQFRVRGSTITGASPPQFVSLEDVMKAAHGFQNMALAHEIAVDQDFKLEPFEPPDNSYQKLVKETMHRAYFDILREQLNADPPVYSHALILLEDVKKGLFSILFPWQTRIRQMIEEVLDGDFIRQQAENNSLDFHKYAKFVIDLMAKLAAPVRDEMIENISKLENTVDIFRVILEALEVLKLDVANTLISMIRPHVQAESVQYERTKFDEMLKVSEDGLRYTREWLTRHIDKEGLTLPVSDVNVVRNATAQALSKAYLELIEWDPANNFPETIGFCVPRESVRRRRRPALLAVPRARTQLLREAPRARALHTLNRTITLDAPRFAELGTQVYRMVAVAAILLVSPSVSQADQSEAAQFKKEMKSRIYIIIGDASSDTELKSVLPSVAEEVISTTESLLDKFNQGPLSSEHKDLIRQQVTSLRDPEHKVRVIVRQRVLEFLKQILVCGGGSKQVPIGLSALSQELTSIAGTLLRYVMHNKAVFTSHYMDIVAAELAKS